MLSGSRAQRQALQGDGMMVQQKHKTRACVTSWESHLQEWWQLVLQFVVQLQLELRWWSTPHPPTHPPTHPPIQNFSNTPPPPSQTAIQPGVMPTPPPPFPGQVGQAFSKTLAPSPQGPHPVPTHALRVLSTAGFRCWTSIGRGMK